MDFVTALVRKYLSSVIRSGDVISLTADPYRNDGVFIWSGTKLVNLSSKLDEYGHVPAVFLSLQSFLHVITG